MAEKRTQRRLATILAGDVVGYSRLMEADEAGTLAMLKAWRKDVLEPLVAKHQGRIFNVAGDGVLVEFASAVNAVQCAVDIQWGMVGANNNRSDELRIVLRIGVNLGDVIVEGRDLYGDGVNIAARLQAMADPGGILVSGTTYDHIKNKVKVGFDDLGAQNLKNIAEPVRAYRVTGTPMVAVESPKVMTDKPSIAVLPFTNLSGDTEQGYFSDGITEGIITELSRFRELLVIARNSSYQFRGKDIDVKEVGRKLGVQFMVEGSVRKIGNRVRVTVQLIDTASTAHIWAERYDRDLIDIFEIQDEITRTVATQVAGRARATIAVRARSRPTESLSAYDFFLQAQTVVRSAFRGQSGPPWRSGPRSRELSALQAEPFLRSAIELDPNFADAHAMISLLYTIKYFYDRQTQHLENALEAGRLALDLDPAGPGAHNAIGVALTYLHRLDEAGHHLSYAVSLNPNEVYFRGDYASWMNFMGDTDGALREIDEALRRDPYVHERFWNMRGTIETIVGRYADALGSFRRVNPKLPLTRCFEAVCHVELGQFAEAQACLNGARTATPGVTPARHLALQPYADAAVLERLMGALRRADPAGRAE